MSLARVFRPLRSMVVLSAVLSLLGCKKADSSRPVPSVLAPSILAPSASFRAAPAPLASACGSIDCRHFADPRGAFLAVLDRHPRILGVGESHAQQGSEAIEPATRRFTRDLLPLLGGKASHVVIELLLPNPKCERAAEAAEQKQKVVTEHQAKTDQNDYVALGTAAKAIGIAPHALEPTCDDLAKIAAAGDGAVAASLDVITRLATELASRLLAAADAAKDERMIVLYGGALHNDLAPRPGREQWSFGPALARASESRYVELDLVVPEFMSDSAAWRSLPWVPRFDRTSHGPSAALLEPSPGAFVLVFPRTASAPPP